MSKVPSKLSTDAIELNSQWEAYKAVLGTVLASNVQIGAYIKAVKGMNEAVANAMSGTEDAKKKLFFKWCASRATFSGFVLSNVPLETYGTQLDNMDMRVEKMSGFKMP